MLMALSKIENLQETSSLGRTATNVQMCQSATFINFQGYEVEVS